MSDVALPVRIVGGQAVRFALCSADGGAGRALAGRVQVRPHGVPPALINDWIGGWAGGHFVQVGLTQSATGPGATGPLQAFAWVTDGASPGQAQANDPLPLRFVPLAAPAGGFVELELRLEASGWRALAGGVLVGQAEGFAAPLELYQVCHEVWSPAASGSAGVFRGLELDGRLPPIPQYGELYPAGMATSHTPGFLVLRDVGPGPGVGFRWP